MPEYLSVTDVVDEYPVGRTWVFERLAAGDIESFRLGKRRLVVKASLDRYLENARSRDADELAALVELIDDDGRVDVERLPGDVPLSQVRKAAAIAARNRSLSTTAA